jgi:hypothetical protein
VKTAAKDSKKKTAIQNTFFHNPPMPEQVPQNPRISRILMIGRG